MKRKFRKKSLKIISFVWHNLFCQFFYVSETTKLAPFPNHSRQNYLSPRPTCYFSLFYKSIVLLSEGPLYTSRVCCYSANSVTELIISHTSPSRREKRHFRFSLFLLFFFCSFANRYTFFDRKHELWLFSALIVTKITTFCLSIKWTHLMNTKVQNRADGRPRDYKLVKQNTWLFLIDSLLVVSLFFQFFQPLTIARFLLLYLISPLGVKILVKPTRGSLNTKIISKIEPEKDKNMSFFHFQIHTRIMSYRIWGCRL